jgi:selenophosphate synthetase-related protein
LEACTKEMVGKPMKYIAIGLAAGLALEGIWTIQDRDPVWAAVIATALIFTSVVAIAGKERS